MSCSTQEYLDRLGVARLPPATSPFDPGYDPVTLRAHLAQSHALIEILKLSMACWIVADERATREKLAAAREHGVRTVTGGGPFEVAAALGRLPDYLDLCADLGVDRIECGEGFTHTDLEPGAIVAMAHQRGLEVQFELGEKHAGSFGQGDVDRLVELGRRWLEHGAVVLVVEARESAAGVGVFDDLGHLNLRLVDGLVEAFGLDALCFEAPNKSSQFALLDHLGPHVHLSNVRLEELLRVEIYRRGLHSDAFGNATLRPVGRSRAEARG